MARLNETELHMLKLANDLDTLQSVARTMLNTFQALMALVDKHGIGDEESESEPVVMRARAAIAAAKAAGV